MPLKRVKDSDIQPQQSEENLYNFGSRQRYFISGAMQIAKSRVQFPREQRPQNISEFIDKKKEMFLVELSYNTIKEEIKDLDLKKCRKEDALKASAKQLNEDEKKLEKHIENDKFSTQEMVNASDKATQDRKDMEKQIHNIDS